MPYTFSLESLGIPLDATGSGGGGGGVSIGDPIGGSTNSQLLYIDGSGNLADSLMATSTQTIAGFLTARTIYHPSASNIKAIAVDATAAGLGNAMGYTVADNVASAVLMINPAASDIYFNFTHNSDNTAKFTLMTNPGNSTGQLDLRTNGLLVGNTGARITSISDDTSMAADSATLGITQHAAKTYTDNAVAAIPSNNPGGADTNIQYNNAGVFGGDSLFVRNSDNVQIGDNQFFDSSATNPNLVSLSGQLRQFYVSTYTGGSTDVAFGATVQISDSVSSSFTGLVGTAQTGSGTYNASLLTGLSGNVLLQHSSGTVDSAAGLTASVGLTDVGILNTAMQMRVLGGFNTGGATVGTNIGLAIDDQNIGTINYAIRANSGLYVFNEGGDANSDFRVESDTDQNLIFSDASADKVGIGTNSPAFKLDVNGSLRVGTKVNITTGSNASVGTGTLSGGTVTISNTSVTASSLIFLTDTASTLTNVGTLSVSAKTAGTSFTVTSANVLDTSTFNYLIIN